MILIVPLQQFGHIIPTLKLAKRFQDDGFKVTYLVEEKFQDWLENEGFGTEAFPSSGISMEADWRGRYTVISGQFDELFVRLKPTLVLIDFFLSAYSMVALDRKIEVKTYLAVADAARLTQAPITA